MTVRNVPGRNIRKRALHIANVTFMDVIGVFSGSFQAVLGLEPRHYLSQGPVITCAPDTGLRARHSVGDQFCGRPSF